MKDITVTSFTRTERTVIVTWKDEAGISVSHFYRHCDGSWHPDPDTLARGTEFMQALNSACLRYAGRKPAKKPQRKKKERILVWFA